MSDIQRQAMKIGKLVRDKIPDVIRQDGYLPTYYSVELRMLQRALEAKLVEEVAEYIGKPSHDELVDIYEVLLMLASRHGLDADDLSKEAADKRERRGSFRSGVFLESIRPL